MYQKLLLFQVQQIEEAGAVGQHGDGTRVMGAGSSEGGGKLQTLSCLKPSPLQPRLHVEPTWLVLSIYPVAKEKLY